MCGIGLWIKMGHRIYETLVYISKKIYNGNSERVNYSCIQLLISLN